MLSVKKLASLASVKLEVRTVATIEVSSITRKNARVTATSTETSLEPLRYSCSCFEMWIFSEATIACVRV
jgi:hypothetical protein